MTDIERCWLLSGKVFDILGFQITYSTPIYLGSGEPDKVRFDAESIIEEDDKNNNIIGWLHTHPSFYADPTGRDYDTMQAWVACLGKPLFCAIKGIDGTKFWLFSGALSAGHVPVLVKHIKIHNRFLTIRKM